jgi:hypothetical protein
MEGDQPIVTKLSYHITPFGTVLFIPGYWSLDSERDINWGPLKRHHQSRGVVKRQGVTFEPKRREREKKEREALNAKEASDALGERGAARIARTIKMANLPEDTDPAIINRLVRAAEKKRWRGP